MTPSVTESIAAFLVPDDEAGASLLGDLAEVHARDEAELGRLEADRRYIAQVIRSLPGLVAAGLGTWGWRGIIRRTLPAVLLGYMTVAVLVISTDLLLGWTGLHSAGSSLAVGFGCGVAGGWATARIARTAPRQHGAMFGAFCMAVGLLLSGDGGGTGTPAWYWLALQVLILPAGWLGGWLCWQQRRRRRLPAQ